jgi:hypothetical protein
MPGPDFGSEKYAICTYPLAESAAIAGAGRAHPRTPWSVVSAAIGGFQVLPFDDFDVCNTTLESVSDSHQTA